MANKPTLTVFTPAYNRAHTIERCYKSLLRQTSKDFKWVIVDDGSKDNTRELVEGWMKENLIPIEYYYKKNGGMHTAHNEAYRHINTELAVCIDSDDYMTDDGVELIISRWRKYGSEKYAGMIGLDIFEDGYVVGTCFPKGLKECKTYDLARKYGVVCDKKYVYRPEVIKKYLPYPEIEGERYGTVNWLYQVIDHDYDMLCSNDRYCVVEYQPDGLSVNTFNQIKQSPRTWSIECNYQMKYQGYFMDRLKRAIQYVVCSMLSKNKRFISEAYSKSLTIFAIPFGLLYYVYLKNKKIKVIDLSKVKHPYPQENGE